MVFASLAFIAMTTLVGCSNAPQHSKCADAEVAQFHQYLDAGNYNAILAEVDTNIWVVNKNQLRLWLGGNHRTLGPALDSRATMVQKQIKGGTGLRCWYETRYEAGVASEKFWWSSLGAHPKLAFYEIMSLGTTPKIGNGPTPN